MKEYVKSSKKLEKRSEDLKAENIKLNNDELCKITFWICCGYSSSSII
jgi:hypothetical protein